MPAMNQANTNNARQQSSGSLGLQALAHGSAISAKQSMANPYMPPSATDNWATPKDLWQQANGFHDFELDAAASLTNHLCDEWFGLDHPDESRRDGLSGQWVGRTWVNPPYGRGIYDSVKKAALHENQVMKLLGNADSALLKSILQKLIVKA